MSTQAIEISNNRVAKHNLTLSRIHIIKEHSATLKVEGVKDHSGLRKVVKTRKFIKKIRLSVETRRKELNADMLREMRENNFAARFIINELKPTEKYLNNIEKEIANEKQRIKLEKERLELERLQKRIDALLAYDAAFDIADIKKMTDAEFSLALDKAKFDHTARQAMKEQQAKQLVEENNRLKEENEKLKQSIPASEPMPAEHTYEPNVNAPVLPEPVTNEPVLSKEESDQIKASVKAYAMALIDVPIPKINNQQAKVVFLAAHTHISTGINMLLKAVE